MTHHVTVELSASPGTPAARAYVPAPHAIVLTFQPARSCTTYTQATAFMKEVSTEEVIPVRHSQMRPSDVYAVRPASQCKQGAFGAVESCIAMSHACCVWQQKLCCG